MEVNSMDELETLKELQEKVSGVKEYWIALDWAISQIEQKQDKTDEQKAIEILSDPMSQIRELDNGGIEMIDDSLVKACDLAISALAKQVPMRPKIDKRRGLYYCPTCETYIAENKYCSGCGQFMGKGDRIEQPTESEAQHGTK